MDFLWFRVLYGHAFDSSHVPVTVGPQAQSSDLGTSLQLAAINGKADTEAAGIEVRVLLRFSLVYVVYAKIKS